MRPGSDSRVPPRRLVAILAAALVPLVLIACGKKNTPEVPEGREAEFTYPGTYPAPKLVVPSAPVEFEIARPARPTGSLSTRGDRNRTRVFGPVTSDPLLGLPNPGPQGGTESSTTTQ